MTATAASAIRLTPNLFGIGFGVAGLAQAWAVAVETVEAPSWPSYALWVLAAALWLLTLAAYVRNVVAQGRSRTELPDPVLGPFTALIAIVPMMLGVALAPHSRTAGEVVYPISLVVTVLLGGWLTGLWIRSDTRLPQWHPGYFIPTVAGGLIAANGSATATTHSWWSWCRSASSVFTVARPSAPDTGPSPSPTPQSSQTAFTGWTAKAYTAERP